MFIKNLIFFSLVPHIINIIASHPLANNLECYFDEDKVISITGYTCTLLDVNINITKPSQKIHITGSHEGEKTNENVINIKIINSHTPFIVPEILEAFPNVEGLEIRKSSLQRIQAFVLSTAEKLKDLIIVDNNIPTLEHGAFEGLENVEHILLINNHIEKIEENAFFGLGRLQTLRLTNNRFSSLPSTLFGSLTSLRKLFITHSFLSRIDGLMFQNNTMLQQLILSDNKIKEIESTFVDELVDLEMLKLKDNVCVDRDFTNTASVENYLDKCFDNFVHRNSHDESLSRENYSPSSEKQRLIIEVQGKFTILSETGDVLYAN